MNAPTLAVDATLDRMLERPLPHSVEMERAILGSIILDNALMNEAVELLRPADFYVRAHQFVFRAMLALHARGVVMNPLFMGEELRREGALEQVGGIPFLSELAYGLPHVARLAPYATIVLETAARRGIVKGLNKICSEALEEDGEPSALLDRMKETIAAFDEECARSDTRGRASLITSFADFMSTNFEDGEEIAFHARRGELALVQSVTNHGKSTLIRNVALALPSGLEFLPVVAGTVPRRVMLLNFEGSARWFQSDLRVMTRDFDDASFDLLRRNFFPTHAPAIDGEPLSLSRHLRVLEAAARRAGGVDVLIIDTASAAFSLRNENDNSEVANAVMKPLVRLARKLNCVVVLVHHVGKAKAEEGAAREQAHRGRGASAWGDFSTSIFNLDADPHEQERVTLTCGKRKNGGNYETVLRLDRAQRWFRATGEMPAKPVTNDDLVLEAIEGIGEREIPTAEIVSAVAGRVSERTAKESLNRLERNGKVIKIRWGWWVLPEVCAVVQLPIGSCTTAQTPVENVKPLPGTSLAIEPAVSPNGNGFHGGDHVRR
ncbi:MAG: AAA family ATPase [Acidobacteria bacterium]|nr:AAA family ATPase [Acidobacteriota bacterium]